MVKNCDRGLEYFQDLGHSFSPYRPPSWQITHIYLKTVYSSCQKLYNLKIYTKYIYLLFSHPKKTLFEKKQRCLYFIIFSNMINI